MFIVNFDVPILVSGLSEIFQDPRLQLLPGPQLLASEHRHPSYIYHRSHHWCVRDHCSPCPHWTQSQECHPAIHLHLQGWVMEMQVARLIPISLVQWIGRSLKMYQKSISEGATHYVSLSPQFYPRIRMLLWTSSTLIMQTFLTDSLLGPLLDCPLEISLSRIKPIY